MLVCVIFAEEVCQPKYLSNYLRLQMRPSQVGYAPPPPSPPPLPPPPELMTSSTMWKEVKMAVEGEESRMDKANGRG